MKTASSNTGDISNDQSNSALKMNWLELLSLIWTKRKFIILATITVTLLAVIYSLILPASYKSVTVILPDSDKSKMGGLGDLASLAGVNVGGDGSLVKLYPTIIQSESVLTPVIYAKYALTAKKDSIDLITYFGISESTPARDLEIALILLRTALAVTLDSKTNVLTVSIETEDPLLSAGILNQLVKELDKYIRTKKNSNASEQKKWIGARLNDVRADLELAENNLREFREKNRRVADSPQLLLEQERFIREVQINSTLYAELKKQLELAKIEEIKSIPIISVLDKAVPATRKTSPMRTRIVLFSCLFAFIASLGYTLTEKTIRTYLVQILAIFKS